MYVVYKRSRTHAHSHAHSHPLPGSPQDVHLEESAAKMRQNTAGTEMPALKGNCLAFAIIG